MSVTEAEPRLQQLWMWWLSIDETMQQVLDDISVRAPEAVAQVLGGPDAELLTAPGGTKFSEHLWAQLSAGSADYEDGRQRPHVVLAGAFRTPATHAVPETDLAFQWEEVNNGGSANSPEDARHRALVMIQDQTGAVVASQEETFTTPDRGETVAREIMISGLSDGSYWAKLFTPYQDGAESTPGAEAAPAIEFTVGQADANLPLGVDNLDTMLWAIAERFAALSERAGAGDTDIGPDIDVAVSDLNGVLASVGAPPALEYHFGGVQGEQSVQGGRLQSVLSNASTALGRFADSAPAIVRQQQALEDSRDLADFKAAMEILQHA